MRRILGAVFTVAFLVISGLAQEKDVVGWQEARFGMNEAQLVAAFKGTLTKSSERFIGDNYYIDFELSDYEIEGVKYKVSFKMSKETDTLGEVLIQGKTNFSGLESLLKTKYGEPTGVKNQNNRGMVLQVREWVFPSTTIQLGYSSFDGFQLVSIRYFASKKREVNKV